MTNPITKPIAKLTDTIQKKVLAAEPTKRMMMNGAVDTLFDKTASQLVGQPITRVDADLKVSGQAPYSAEFYRDNQAYGVLVGATIAKGTVKNIDTSAVMQIAGVIKVVTDPKHFARNSQQGGKTRAPTQGAHEVAYHGQPIAVVVAETFEAASEGAKALQITYDEQVDDAALDFKAELSNAHAVNEQEGSDKNSEQGDPEKGLANAEVSVDCTYTTPSQNSAAMEPHATLAYWEGEQLTLHTSNQMPAFGKSQVADALGLDKDNVRFISRFIGGGFGSKLGIAPESIAAAICAKELERPVLIVMTRPQVFEATVRRSNTQQRIALGCSKDGIIDTIIHDTVSSNLPKEAFFEPAGLSTHFLYQGKNRRVSYKMVDMNWVLSGSMRAPGEAVGQIALECAMDELADKLNIDPIELRRLNEPKEDPSKHIPFSTRKLLPCIDTGAAAFGWAQRHPQPATQLEGDWWIGMGMAVASRGNQLMPSTARATLQVDAAKTYGVKAVIETAMTDIGTGTYTVFAQIAADLLGLPIDHIEVKLGDTEFPWSSGSGGSFGAASSGSAVYLACAELRDTLAKKVGLYSDNVQLQLGQICQAGEHDPSLVESVVEGFIDDVVDAVSHNIADVRDTVSETVSHKVVDKISAIVSDKVGDKFPDTDLDKLLDKVADTADKVIGMGKDMATSVIDKVDNIIDNVAKKAGVDLPTDKLFAKGNDAAGNALTDKAQTDKAQTDKAQTDKTDYNFSNAKTYPIKDLIAQYDDQKISAKGEIAPGKNLKSHRQASYGANFAEVAVHRATGEIRVRRMTGVFAAGRILNHKTATSQCYGGMVFGIGAALMEEVIHDKASGRLCNHDLAEYHIPVNADVPQLEVILLEEDDPYTNPMHIKGIGETAIAGAGAAIANAIYNAVGVRVYDFPITLDKLLDGMPE